MNRLLLIYSGLIAASIVIGVVPSPNSNAKAQDSGSSRKADVDDKHLAHLAMHGVEYEWFAHAGNGFDGVPFILVRLLPELAPEIWGSPEEDFGRFGFFRTKADAKRPLPTALGWDVMQETQPGTVRKVTLTCGACHIGRVRVGTESSGAAAYKDLVGAPNIAIDARKWRRAFERFVAKSLSDEQSIKATAAALRDLIAVKPKGFFFGPDASPEEETSQRRLFSENCERELMDLARKVRLGMLAVNKQRITSYSRDRRSPLNGGTPGQSDGSGDLIPKLLLLDDMAAMEPAAAVGGFLARSHPALTSELATLTDIVSTWRQSDRTVAQLDGSVKSPFYRNIAAILAVVGNPKAVNAKNADISARFIRDLPPPAYPFEIDRRRAERGAKLFEANCRVCHRAHNEQVYPLIGTDTNRSRVLNSDTVKLFVKYFQASVPEGMRIEEPPGNAIDPRSLGVDDIVNSARSEKKHQGYLAPPLEGVWARGPYLHNGSVPTLRHLLAPGHPASRRPSRFMRGSWEFDRHNVGFAWSIEQLTGAGGDESPIAEFDTTWDGATNVGHDRDLILTAGPGGESIGLPSSDAGEHGAGRILRMNWSKPEHERELADLLEYLKSL